MLPCTAKRILCIVLIVVDLLGLLLFLWFIGTIAEHFSPIYRCFSVLSPDGRRIAAVECEDQGALGGRSYVYIRNRETNNPFPKSSGGQKIVDTGHLYPDDVKICWTDNDTLQFNGYTYGIP